MIDFQYACSLPSYSQQSGLAQVEARIVEVNSGGPHGWQTNKPLSHYLLTARMNNRRKEDELRSKAGSWTQVR